MKLPLIIILILLTITIACVAPTTTPSPQPTPIMEPPRSPSSPPVSSIPASPVFTEALAIRVIDGDTIEVAIGGNQYKIRYIGIDCPETLTVSGPQPCSQEATAKNRELTENKIVKLEKDISETDKYGRLLRYVYIGSLFINAEMIRLGYAQVFTYPPDVKYHDLFLKLQQEARESKRGLWADRPVPPSPASNKYLGSKNSNKYHYPTCSSAKQIKPENIIWFQTAAEAQAKGYSPCGSCKPPLKD